MAGVPDDWKAAAVAITPGFEVQGDPYEGVSGDFDGMGISCGALQWNIGKGSLQPMVLAVGKAGVQQAMPTHGIELWTACTSPIRAGLKIVRTWQNGSKLRAVPKAELRALMGSAAMRAEQDKRIAKVADIAMAGAEAWARSAGRTAVTKRGFCWFFDLTTQNGSLNGTTYEGVANFIRLNTPGRVDDVICDYLEGLKGTSGHIKDARRNAALWRDKAVAESLELLVLSYLRSETAKPVWRPVVINRKGTIALGRGWVNSGPKDFSAFGL